MRRTRRSGSARVPGAGRPPVCRTRRTLRTAGGVLVARHGRLYVVVGDGHDVSSILGLELSWVVMETWLLMVKFYEVETSPRPTSIEVLTPVLASNNQLQYSDFNPREMH